MPLFYYRYPSVCLGSTSVAPRVCLLAPTVTVSTLLAPTVVAPRVCLRSTLLAPTVLVPTVVTPTVVTPTLVVPTVVAPNVAAANLWPEFFEKRARDMAEEANEAAPTQ